MALPSFLFWQRWLFYSSLLYALAGVIFAFFGSSFLFSPYQQLMAETFWHQSEIPNDIQPFISFIYKPIGGTIACCYLLVAFIAQYSFKEKQTWARNAIIVAFGLWVIIDSIGCFQAKMYPQIYFINAFSIVTKALPIICTWKHFTGRNSNSWNHVNNLHIG